MHSGQLSQVLGEVVTAAWLAWCKHLPSQPLAAQHAVKMHPEKILRSSVGSFHEADPPPGKGWPEFAQVDCCLCKCLESD